MKDIKVEISSKTIIFITAFLLGLWFVFLIRDILLLLYVSFILMSALKPAVNNLEKRRLPRPAAIGLIYFIGIILVAGMGGSVIPPLLNQSNRFFRQLPDIAAGFLNFFNIDSSLLTGELARLSGDLLSITLGFFNNLLTTLTVVVFTFYFLLERKHIDLILTSFLNNRSSLRVTRLLDKIEHRLGSWARGQIVLATIVGVMSFIGLSLLRVDYALPLAIIAGVLEIVPIIGPVISAVPAVIVAAGTSPVLALAVASLFFVIQQLENHLLVPLVLRKSVGLPPLVTIISLLIGARVGGIGGALISIPVVVTLQIVIQNLIADEA